MTTKHLLSATALVGAIVTTFAARSPYVSVSSANAGERGCHDMCADHRDECFKHAHDDHERERCDKDRNECDRGCDDHR